jgi:hypothetical protein
MSVHREHSCNLILFPHRGPGFGVPWQVLLLCKSEWNENSSAVFVRCSIVDHVQHNNLWIYTYCCKPSPLLLHHLCRIQKDLVVHWNFIAGQAKKREENRSRQIVTSCSFDPVLEEAYAHNQNVHTHWYCCSGKTETIDTESRHARLFSYQKLTWQQRTNFVFEIQVTKVGGMEYCNISLSYIYAIIFGTVSISWFWRRYQHQHRLDSRPLQQSNFNSKS